jgi:hypothetical protein
MLMLLTGLTFQKYGLNARRTVLLPIEKHYVYKRVIALTNCKLVLPVMDFIRMAICFNPRVAKQSTENDVKYQKTFMMDTFEIEVATGGSSITYTIKPLEDGSFQVSQKDDAVGIVFPNTRVNGVTWTTDDDIDDDLLENIGKAIEAEKL